MFIGYVKNNSKLFKFSVRLNNIDCPEIKSKKSPDKTEYEIAVKAKNYVQDLILNEIVNLKDVNLDKYGRLLANVYFNNEKVLKIDAQRVCFPVSPTIAPHRIGERGEFGAPLRNGRREMGKKEESSQQHCNRNGHNCKQLSRGELG